MWLEAALEYNANYIIDYNITKNRNEKPLLKLIYYLSELRNSF